MRELLTFKKCTLNAYYSGNVRKKALNIRARIISI